MVTQVTWFRSSYPEADVLTVRNTLSIRQDRVALVTRCTPETQQEEEFQKQREAPAGDLPHLSQRRPV